MKLSELIHQLERTYPNEPGKRSARIGLYCARLGVFRRQVAGRDDPSMAVDGAKIESILALPVGAILEEIEGDEEVVWNFKTLGATPGVLDVNDLPCVRATALQGDFDE